MMKTIEAGRAVLQLRQKLSDARAVVRQLESDYHAAEEDYLRVSPDLAYVNCLIGTTLIAPVEDAWECQKGKRLQFFEVDEASR